MNAGCFPIRKRWAGLIAAMLAAMLGAANHFADSLGR